MLSSWLSNQQKMYPNFSLLRSDLFIMGKIISDEFNVNAVIIVYMVIMLT